MNAKQQLERLTQLKALGACVEEEQLVQACAQHSALSLFADPRTSRIYEVLETPEGGTGIETRIRVRADQSGSTITIRERRIILDWVTVDFLPEPLGGWYRSFGKNPHPIDAMDTLNSILRPGERLFPGEEREGLVLGYGRESIPTEFQHRDRVAGTLWFLDSRNNEYKVPVTLTVIRANTIPIVNIQPNPGVSSRE
jgi:hypothetical protein